MNTNKIITNKDSKEKNKGYTLVEFMVASFVFLSAIAVIFGTFTHTIRANRDANDMIIVNSDAAIITEMLTREVRAGYDFSASGSAGCSIGVNSISFTREADNPGEGPPVDIDYQWNRSNGTIERRKNSGSWEVINSTRNNVNRFCFLLTQNSNDHPWRITSVFSLEPVSGRTNSVNFQTTVTSRNLPGDS